MSAGKLPRRLAFRDATGGVGQGTSLAESSRQVGTTWADGRPGDRRRARSSAARRVHGTGDDQGFDAADGGRHVEHPTDDLPGPRGGVEAAFARDDEARPGHAVTQRNGGRHHVEARDEASPHRGEPTAEPTGGAGARHVFDVHAISLPVACRQGRQPVAQEHDLLGPRTLLGTEAGRGVEEHDVDVAGHDQLDAGEIGVLEHPRLLQRRRGRRCPRRSWPTRRHPTTTRRGATAHGGGDELTGPACGGRHRVVAGRAAGQRQPGRRRRLDKGLGTVPCRRPSHQRASTGTPSGPVTVVSHHRPVPALARASTSANPSPPSDIGHASLSQPTAPAPRTMACAIAGADAVPLNASGAASASKGSRAWSGGIGPIVARKRGRRR